MKGLIDNTLLIFFSSIAIPFYDARRTPTNATFNNLIDLGAFQTRLFYSMKKAMFFYLRQYKVIIINPIYLNFNVISNFAF